MNERIRELTKQAGISILYEYDGYDGHAAVANLADIEKFAELIVRECILTIQMGITRDGTKTEKFKRSMTHIKDIKEHFGVEE